MGHPWVLNAPLWQSQAKPSVCNSSSIPTPRQPSNIQGVMGQNRRSAHRTCCHTALPTHSTAAGSQAVAPQSERDVFSRPGISVRSSSTSTRGFSAPAALQRGLPVSPVHQWQRPWDHSKAQISKASVGHQFKTIYTDVSSQSDLRTNCCTHKGTVTNHRRC